MDQSPPSIPGYTLTAQLYIGSHTAVYRAEQDGQTVVIKVLRSRSTNELIRFRNQYIITKNLAIPSIVKPLALVPWNQSYALVMEDVGGIALRDYLKTHGRLTVEQVLAIALQLADSFHHLSQHRILHKDINPANILIHPDTQQIWLTDFSLASLLPKENQELQSPNALEGTLAYIAPEQTGRMNRGIDYRADFYSLGVTLYELLTGELPFQSDDPMELIHCHIAKEPSFEVGSRKSEVGNGAWGRGDVEQGIGRREESGFDASAQPTGFRSQESGARSHEPGVRSQELGARSQKPGVRSQESRARSQEPGGKPPTPDSPLPSPHSPVPTPLSKIVFKLMAKNAEDRYQSPLGLKHDLQHCLEQWQTLGRIEAFELGQQDVCDRFLIPEKLYGREAEVQTLLDAFDRVAQGSSELMLVAGYSGVGKTAVINEVHKPIVEKRGYFVKGKCDQFNCNIPFSAFVQVFRDLMWQLLGESDAQLQMWKARILTKLGDNGQVLIDVMPELEAIIGPQPPVPELSGSAAQNRFNLLFEKFIAIFATQDHPLVMFLDDLQWMDSASLNLLNILMADNRTGYLLLLGAYRDNEVFAAHPLMLALADLEKQNTTLSTITLAPLSASHINQLVAETLSCAVALAAPLTDIVYQKTIGNPFFTIQFLKGLHGDGLITFDDALSYWECDLVQVRDAALTANVVEFMVGRLHKLPSATQNVLKLAACIGNQFDLETLAITCETPSEEVATDLWSALREGLILPQSQTYKFFHGLEESEENLAGIAVGYRFLHDRVQQAAYSLIPDQQKQTMHYRIGKNLLQNTPLESLENRLFAIVNQLNYGIDGLSQPEEKDEVARLNLLACRKAKNATAYRAGREYASKGLSLLAADAWRSHYEITFALTELAAEFAAFCGDWEAMDRLVGEVVANSHSLVEQTNVYRLQIQTHTSRNQLTEAIAVALEFLQHLGVTFPDNPTEADITHAIATVQQLMGDRQVEDLLDLPRIKDAEKIAIVQITQSILSATYISSPYLLFPLVVGLTVSLSIQYGNIPPSGHAYACYGLILSATDVITGVKFGQLALQLADKLAAKTAKPEVLVVAGGFLLHRTTSMRETLPLLQTGYTIALEVGNHEYVGYNSHHFSSHSFWCGRFLGTLVEEINAYCRVLEQINQLTTANYSRIYWQATLNLLGRTESSTLFSGEALQEKEALIQWQSANDVHALFIFHTYKLALCYLFGDLEAACTQVDASRQYLAGGLGTVNVPAFHFYAALNALADLQPASEKTADVLPQVEADLASLQWWADYAPMNYQHKADLVEAEKCRVLGQQLDALELYDCAIAGAKENGYIQEEALANELAAKFYLNWGKEKIATVYMQAAYCCYDRWGATAKTTDLENCYAPLLQPIVKQANTLDPLATLHSVAPLQLSAHSSARSPQPNTDTFNTVLDLATIFKSAQALSESIDLNELLEKLTRMMLQTSGAERLVLLLLDRDHAWQVRVTATPETTQLVSDPLTDNPYLPVQLIQYVQHTREILVLDGFEHELPIVDTYLQRHPHRSVLFLPLLHQAKLIGLLYLEHRSVAGVFSRDRITILNFLCTQAAISLENALLNQALEQRLGVQTAKREESEERLQQVAINVPGMIYQVEITVEGQLTTLYASAYCEVIYEVAAEAMMAGQHNFRDFEHPEDKPVLDQMIAECHQTWTTFDHQFRIITSSGTLKWIHVISHPTRQSETGSTIWDGVIMDVSDRKAAELALQDAQIQFRSMTENVPGMIFRYILHADGSDELTYVSSQVREIFEVKPEIARQRMAYLWERIHPDDLGMVKAQVQHSADTQQPFKSQHRLVLPQKGLRWVQNVAHPACLDNGDVVWDGVCIDITDRKAAELALQDTQAQFHRMTENVPGVISRYILHADGSDEVTYVSSQVREIFEVEPEIAQQRMAYLWERIHPDDLGMVKAQVRHSAETQQPFKGQYRLVLPQKGLRWIQEVAHPECLDNGDVVWDGVCIDITDRKQLEQEKERLIQILQATSDFIGICKPSNGIVWQNQSFRNLRPDLKVFEEQVQIAELYPQWAYNIVRDEGMPTAVRQGTWSGETALLTTSGEEIPTSQVIIAHKSDSGVVEHFSTILRDISDRKAAELALQESEERFRRMTENVPGMIFRYVRYADGHDELTYVSSQVQELFEVAPEIALENTLWDRIHPDDVPRISYDVQVSAETLQPFTSIYRLILPEKGLRWVHNMTSVERLENGDVVWDGIVIDISDRKQAEEQLCKTLAQLEASNNELESFAYSISHDLRAPLRAINGFSQALLEDYGDLFDEQGQDYFARIRSNTNRMSQLIDDLLELSQLSRSELRYTRVDLSALAQEVLDDLQTSEPDRRVEVIVQPGATVFADAALMQVVLMNLLQNAWKFTRNHATARIEFGVLPPDSPSFSTPIYFVKDDGAGFDMTYSHKLFGVFQRLHSNKEFPGTGIGLASVRRAIHRHGGRVWAEAAIEQGVTVFFTMPMHLEDKLSKAE
ncbi:MAG: PAS domain-containing protein [Cyanobacteria bacterium P01_F01_bin.86]